MQLQLSGVFRINLHYSNSFLFSLTETQLQETIAQGILNNFLQVQLHDLMVFELKM